MMSGGGFSGITMEWLQCVTGKAVVKRSEAMRPSIDYIHPILR